MRDHVHVVIVPYSRGKVQTLLLDYEEHGMVSHHHPLSDSESPSNQQCLDMLTDLWGALRSRRKTVIQYVHIPVGTTCTDEMCDDLDIP